MICGTMNVAARGSGLAPEGRVEGTLEELKGNVFYARGEFESIEVKFTNGEATNREPC